MNAIKILAETDVAVTISRKDWMELIAAVEDSEDRAAVRERHANEKAVGKEAARRSYLTVQEARRLLDGENPVRLWRGKRGLSQRQLAGAANISPSYLAEIESGQKPGSADAIGKLAQILGVPKEELMTELQRIRSPDFGPVSLKCWPYDIGVSPGNRGAGPEIMKFLTLRNAVEYARDHWQRMSVCGVIIETMDGKIIYDLESLYREIDPGSLAR